MTIELANRIRHGRAVGNEYVVTNRDEGNSMIIARFDTREDAAAYIATHAPHPEPVISLAEYYAAQDDTHHDEERS